MNVAAIIWGEQNSGKSSTWLKTVTAYTDKTGLTRVKRGWQSIIPNPNCSALHLWTYLFPASPTESKLPLHDHFAHWKSGDPKILFVSEQPNGANSQSTIHWLTLNNYHTLNYHLSNKSGIGTWDRFDNKNAVDKHTKLQARADQIISDLRTYLRSKRIL